MNLRPLVGALVRLAMVSVPKQGHAIVYGWPSDEPNSTEIARALARHLDGQIVWLDPPESASEVEGADPGRITLIPKNTLRGFWSFCTASVVFFSDGLYGFPKPIRRTPFVNLWHGDGPKATLGNFIPSTYLVTNSPVLAEDRRRKFGVRPEHLVAVGTPRLNQLSHPTRPAQLAALGIDPDRPFVLWLPTYRRVARSAPTRSWVDVIGPDLDPHINSTMAAAVHLFDEAGIQLVVKPHPLDEQRPVDGAIHLTGAALAAAGTSLYRLISASAGLITDYSSVWSDFLALDRPIAFFLPDLEAYRGGRGLEPRDIIDWLPGEPLDDEASFRRFTEEVRLPSEAGGASRRRTAERIGFRPAHDPALALLQRLADDRVLRLRPGSGRSTQ